MDNMEGKTPEAEVFEKPKFKTTKDLVIKVAVGIVVTVILVGGYFYSLQKKNAFTADKAQSKVVDFVSKNLVQPGTKVEVKEAVKANGMYKITLDVSGQQIPTYITMDGKIFFPQGIDLAEAEQKAEEARKAAEIPKSDNPKVDLYVMSFCPYGNKAEDTLKPVYNLLKNEVDFNFHYIVSTEGNTVLSLHGAKEVAQNEREACVLKAYGKDKWMDFVTYVNGKCGSDGVCWEAGARSLGISAAQVNACVKSDGLALMKVDEQASNEADASGSPTLMINEVSSSAVYQYGNSESYKQAICDSFNNAPSECSQTLSGSTTTAQGGSCATQ